MELAYKRLFVLSILFWNYLRQSQMRDDARVGVIRSGAFAHRVWRPRHWRLPRARRSPAAGGRITVELADDEMTRLRSSWSMSSADRSAMELDQFLDEAALSSIDPFDRVQLAEVVRVCRANHTLSEAGRQLFAVSRTKKGTPNDADRLRKYLARFGLDWARVRMGNQQAV
jgi:sigma54-dependent transcription regulator